MFDRCSKTPGEGYRENAKSKIHLGGRYNSSIFSAQWLNPTAPEFRLGCLALPLDTICSYLAQLMPSWRFACMFGFRSFGVPRKLNRVRPHMYEKLRRSTYINDVCRSICFGYFGTPHVLQTCDCPENKGWFFIPLLSNPIFISIGFLTSLGLYLY